MAGSPRDREGDAAPPPTARALDVTVSDAGEGDLGDLDAPPTADGSLANLLGEVARAPSAAPPMDLGAGTVVDNTFRIVRVLGSGGMGVVYLARDQDLQRDVALKVHRVSTGLDRLQREAVAMAQLAHPNVLTVHAVGQVQGRLYIAMEYVPGATLRAWLEAAPRPWREVVDLMMAAGEGLAAAHAAGFVHRDFKPENVLVGRDGRPRVGDFGLVRVAGDLLSQSGILHAATSHDDLVAPSALAETMDATSRDRLGAPPPTPGSLSSNLTATGAALGTPAYMAPEQFADGDVDARADQFAFCVVLSEALAGRRPFRGATYQELRERVTGGTPDPLPRGRAPAWLARALRRGLARDPADRWPDMRALLTALRGPPVRRWLPAAAASVVVAGGAVALYLATRPAATPPEAAPRCDHAGAEIDALWTPARRTELTTRFTAVDPTIGADVATRAGRGVDAWVAGYRAVAVQACRAEKIDRTWPTRVAVAATECLRKGRAAMIRTLDRALRADRESLPFAAGDARTPFPIDDCVDERLLISDYQVPEDPAVAARVDGLIDRIFEVTDLLDSDRVEEARAAFTALWPEVEREAYPAATARALMLDGLIARAERHFDVAVTRLEQSYAAARGAGLDSAALNAARWLIWVEGVDRERVAAARPWIVQALPEAERHGLHHRSASAVFYSAAVVAEIDADYDRAIELHERRVAALEAGDDADYAAALAGLGTSLDAAGRSAEALPHYTHALSVLERDFGAEHPQTVWIRSNIVIAEVAVGNIAGAVAAAERGVALLDRTPGVPAIEATGLRFNHAFALESAGRDEDAIAVYLVVRASLVELSGEDSADVADVDANLGQLDRKAGRFAEARRRLVHALTVRRALFGDDHDEVADVYTHLGDLELTAKGCAQATPRYEQAIASYRASATRSGVAIDRISGALTGLGNCRRKAGKAAGAVELLTEARTRADHGGLREQRFSATLGLAWALDAARQPGPARAAFLDARALIRDDDPTAAEDRAEIDRWLAKN